MLADRDAGAFMRPGRADCGRGKVIGVRYKHVALRQRQLPVGERSPGNLPSLAKRIQIVDLERT